MKDPTTRGKEEEPEPVVGDSVDRRFLLKREIARGGMGAVFEAEQQITGRIVAIKLAVGEGLRREQAQERLLREARAITVARHPGIIELLDAGVCDHHGPYLVLEVVRGLTLDRVLGVRQTLPVEAVVHIGRQLCDALSFAHSRGVVHRDLKPGNIFLVHDDDGPGEVVKLFDFGIAELTAAAPKLRKLTRETDLLGTPEYMAPEQLGGEQADHRCDIYAVGVTLFECLTGEVPFTGGYRQIVVKVMRSGGAPMVHDSRKDVSTRLAGVIARALAIEPADRFEDCEAFRDALVEATGLDEGRSELLDDGGDGTPLPDSATPPLSTERERSPRGPITAPIPLLRRKHVRAPYESKARLELPDATTAASRTLDVSEGGLLIATDAELQDRQHVFIRLVLPSSGGRVTIQAMVRLHDDLPAGQAGLQFVQLPPEVRQDIADHVAQVLGDRPSGEH